MPARHGPAVLAGVMPQTMGSLLDFSTPDGSRFRLYVSGDTLVYRDLWDIPRRFPGIDLALLHLGGTRVLGILVTMDAAQGVEATRLVDARLTIPIHYNDYTVFRSPLEDFMLAVEDAGLADRVRYLRPGDTHDFALRR
jgi:L-ascorbate metabolism protein UlaG (beta-lactamase superfamily)